MTVTILELLKSSIHVVSSALLFPAIIVLLLFLAITVFELGGLLVEACTERRRPKVKVPEIIKTWQNQAPDAIGMSIENSPLSRYQKALLNELNLHADLSPAALQALARQLMAKEELRYAKITYRTDVIARLSPMFGLMATLIPLGPGMLAFGQGDTKMLADSLLTAFDATVTGLAAAGVAYAISRLRKRWYEGDLSIIGALLESLLEVLSYGRGTEKPQTQDV